MERNCKGCKKFFDCKYYVPFPEQGCSEFVKFPKKYIALHLRLENGFISIIDFGNDLTLLHAKCRNERHFGSSRHYYLVTNNCVGSYGDEPSTHPLFEGITMHQVKDSCLINICKNVAEYLAIGEYAMLKKSYFKASSWFEKANNSCWLGAEILDNY